MIMLIIPNSKEFAFGANALFKTALVCLPLKLVCTYTSADPLISKGILAFTFLIFPHIFHLMFLASSGSAKESTLSNPS